ncbi:MAG: ABC transporter permease, partial [Deltaproteobacteria bacterium]|nr:ABC transporter permease [Deltaproteobacteria bacterium]
MSAVLAMALKEWRLLLRDPGSLALLFVMPSIFILVFSLSLQGVFSSDEEKMDVLVADPAGPRFTRALEDTGHFRAVTALDGAPVTRETILQAIESGDHEIGIVIHPGAQHVEVVSDPLLTPQITQAVTSCLRASALELAIEQLTEAVETMEGELDSLAAAAAELLEINRELLETLLEVHGHLKKASSMMPPGMRPEVSPEQMDEQEAELKARIEKANEISPPGARPSPSSSLTITQTHASSGEHDVEMTSVQASVPGWTIFGLFWIVQILALSIITERASGAYGRILVAPVSFASYLVGKAVPYLVVNLVQAALMFGIGIWVLPLFGAPGLEIANPAATLLVTLAISLCAIAFGLFLASVTRSAFLVGSVSAVILVIMTALGGIMVPTFIMPEVMQKMSLLVPHGWALQGYLDVIVRGRPAADALPEVG